MPHRVERGVALWHELDPVVFVHFWEVVSIQSQLSTGCVPPDGELFFDGASEVGAVRRWLGHQLVEGLLWSLPLRCLHVDEHSCGNGDWQAKNPCGLNALNKWSGQWVTEPVTGDKMEEALS